MEKVFVQAVAFADASRPVTADGRATCDGRGYAKGTMQSQRDHPVLKIGLLVLWAGVGRPVGEWLANTLGLDGRAGLGVVIAFVVAGAPILAAALWVTCRMPQNWVLARYGDEVAVVALIGLSPKPGWVRWYPLPVPAEITPGKTFRRAGKADFGDFCLYFSTNSRFEAALPLLGHADLTEAS